MKISPQIRPPTTGDHSDGLSTTVLPSTSGAAIERAERISAAFHGAIAPTTPTGRRRPIAKAPVSDGITSPSGAYASAAAWRKSPGTKCIWNIPKPNVEPVSRASSETISSRRLSSTSAALRKIALPHGRRRLRPGRRGGGRGLDRAVSIGARGGGDLGDEVAVERVAILERAAALGVGPLAADEEPLRGDLPDVRAHCFSLCSIRAVQHSSGVHGAASAAAAFADARARNDLCAQCSIPWDGSLVSGT